MSLATRLQIVPVSVNTYIMVIRDSATSPTIAAADSFRNQPSALSPGHNVWPETLTGLYPVALTLLERDIRQLQGIKAKDLHSYCRCIKRFSLQPQYLITLCATVGILAERYNVVQIPATRKGPA